MLRTTRTSVCLVFIFLKPTGDQPALRPLDFGNDRDLFPTDAASEFIDESAVFTTPMLELVLVTVDHILHLLHG